VKAKGDQGDNILEVHWSERLAAGATASAKNPGPLVLLVINGYTECLLWLSGLFDVLKQQQLNTLDYSICRYAGEKTY
jgi:hypothetical protein